MQKESGHNRSSNARRLVLGLDAGRSTCSSLAARLEKRVGEKLDVRNLRDLDVREWREQALGEDDEWAPTLFEVEDGKVREWSGWRMGWVLSRTFGPAATWRVMQVLGEVGAASEIGESALDEKLPEEGVLGMERG